MTVIGERVPRSDGRTKVSGEAVYGVDYDEVGMIWGALLRSPVSSGRITRLDTGPALAMPGVHAVLTAADAPDAHAGWVLRDQRLFAGDRVRYEGEPIAAVAAETLALARAAVAAIGLEIEPLPAVVDLDVGDEPGLAVGPPGLGDLRPGRRAGLPPPRQPGLRVRLRPARRSTRRSRAAHRVSTDEFVAQRQYQAYIEPKSAVGIYRDGRYTVHYRAPVPLQRARPGLAVPRRPAVRGARGRPHIGGGFGAKLDAGLEPYAALLSKAVGGRPVKLVNTRTEDMLVPARAARTRSSGSAPRSTRTATSWPASSR